MKFIYLIWRKIFSLIQVNLPKYYHIKILRILNKLAVIYHECYENKNYDINSNGEKFLLKKLRKSNNLNCIFDVGANKGDYSMLSRVISPKAKIFAFEPVFETFEILISNLKGIGISTHNFALGDIVGSSEINLYEKDTLSSMVNFQNEFLNKDFKKIKINVKTGNSFLKEKPEIKEISLLKIDTEGYENKVLEGFNEFFKIINVIQFEYGLANLSSKYFLFDYFKDYSSVFKIGKLYPGGVVFFDEYNINIENFIGPNFVMVRKDRKDLIELLSFKKS